MDDVKDQDVQAEEAIAEETATQEPQPGEQTTDAPEKPVETKTATEEATERMVPLSVVREERRKRQEAQRKLAEVEGNRKLDKYDPNDLESVMNHPYVQELRIKEAKRELTDFARDTLDQFPNFPAAIKKQILKNVRGFVNEDTTDIEQGKLDVQEYIESVIEDAEEAVAQTAPETPTAKNFPIVETNTAKTDVAGVTPAQVQKVLNKPVDEWSADDEKIVEEYTKSQK